MDKREIERRVKNVKLQAVHLKNRVFDVKKSTGIDLRDEIIEYLEDMFKGKETEEKNEINNHLFFMAKVASKR